MAAWYGHDNIIASLARRGANVDRAKSNGDTPMLNAAFLGRANAVKALLAAGADPNIRDKDGKNSLEVAREQKHDDVVKLLESVTKAAPAARAAPAASASASSASPATGSANGKLCSV
jgi:ankyrin repeat protein